MNEETVEMANKALKLSPDNERILYVKLTGQLNLNLLNAAYNTSIQLVKIAPNNQNYQQILANLSQRN